MESPNYRLRPSFRPMTNAKSGESDIQASNQPRIGESDSLRRNGQASADVSCSGRKTPDVFGSARVYNDIERASP